MPGWRWCSPVCGISGTDHVRPDQTESKNVKPTLITALLTLLFDQLVKIAVVEWAGLKTLGLIEVWPPYLSFRMAWNTGVNFGLFANDAGVMRWILVTLALAISAWLLVWSRSMGSQIARLSAGLVIGGAIGNSLDRLIYGAVADFLNMSCCGFDNPYAFNVADIAIFLGAFGLVLYANKQDKHA
ncbi:MAG: signal peptidase II [Rhodobacteraceae bacterium]|nr:signal peptidase II [Paracoccaceae bacterium]